MTGEERARAIKDSIRRHFEAGCAFLDPVQFEAHISTGSCVECESRWTLKMANERKSG